MEPTSLESPPARPNPPREPSFLRHALIAFVIALVGYSGFYALDQHLRHRKGPWVVELQKTGENEPRLIIEQPSLGIRDVEIIIRGQPVTNAPAVYRFDTPKNQPPFGKMIYHDLTYLPGAVVLEWLGHEIQMIPRTLVINKKEMPWTNGASFELIAR